MAKKKPAKKTPPPALPSQLLAGFHAACRDGDQTALGAWADALEEAGDGEAAGLLRRLPQARKEMAKRVRSWCKEYPGSGEVSLHHQPDSEEGPYWFCGDCEIEGDDAIDVVGPLLARWDEFHPAIEWLVRELGLPFVERRTKPKGKRKEASTSYRLGSGDHFDPLPQGHLFSSLSCRQADPDAPDDEEDADEE